ncbi:hypothetical protein AALP_AA8G259000 [Arabis alpina]|uniref:Uncharacterized protein n=1 Tax=Arabis alpina TaxID=50452 RepID=A0A087G9G2_ARAAL|nr:hypothetical protein AALP_AA8G259000 [Arabis alpina]
MKNLLWISLMLGETEEAVSSLMKPFDILWISHGTSTPFMKELYTRCR